MMPNSTSQDRNEVAQDHEDNKNRHEEASIARVLKYTGLFGGVQVIYALIAIVRNKITAYSWDLLEWDSSITIIALLSF